ncbi:MAG: hypothetical protein NVV63_14095 [Opitutus sp.]|nr:hypothetical protein [Opitutus sp.]
MDGKAHQLSGLKGKIVVIEWTNPDCPFVQKHYQSGNIPKLQKAAAQEGVVWLVVETGSNRAADKVKSWQRETAPPRWRISVTPMGKSAALTRPRRRLISTSFRPTAWWFTKALSTAFARPTQKTLPRPRTTSPRHSMPSKLASLSRTLPPSPTAAR